MQAEIDPPKYLLRRRGSDQAEVGHHKFHIRTYVVVKEEQDNNDESPTTQLSTYLYQHHEVRVAGQAVNHDLDHARSRDAHMTNGAIGTTERLLLHEEPQLAPYKDALEAFIMKMMHELEPNLRRHVLQQRNAATMDNENSTDSSYMHQFAMAGIDIMMTEMGQFYVLEFNVNPAAPPQKEVSRDFEHHLIKLMSSLIRLVVSPSSDDVLDFRRIRFE